MNNIEEKYYVKSEELVDALDEFYTEAEQTAIAEEYLGNIASDKDYDDIINRDSAFGYISEYLSESDFVEWIKRRFPKVIEQGDISTYVEEDDTEYRVIETQRNGTCYCESCYDTDKGCIIDVYDDEFEFIGEIVGDMDDLTNTQLAGLIDDEIE